MKNWIERSVIYDKKGKTNLFFFIQLEVNCLRSERKSEVKAARRIDFDDGGV